MSARLNEWLSAAPDPDAARTNAERIREAAAEHHLRPFREEQWQALLPLLDCGAPVSRISANPRWVSWLTAPAVLEREKAARTFESELRARTSALQPDDTAGLDRVLRLYRHREMCRIILRDLSRRAPLHVVLRELSHLADALVGAAVRFWDLVLARRFGAPLGDGFCVIAMGKHGAEELNYSSDIDVLFVFDRDASSGGGKTRRDHALALARAVIKSLSAPTEHGIAFRVDANLRPYGRDGQLAQSLDEMERYYERAGQTWERSALIKARPCAGGLDLGTQLLERLTPFVFRRTLDLDAVRAIANMKRQIDLEEARSSQDNVKLGPGGIREIEFFAQALQLLHGGREPRLRVRSTLPAMGALLHAGHLSAQDLDVFSNAYVFLRDTEHRLQIPGDQQTHSLPAVDDDRARLALARRMGFQDRETFESVLDQHRKAVRVRFESLFSTAAEDLPISAHAEIAVSTNELEDVRLDALQALGFAEPETALTDLRRLARQPEGVFGVRGAERYRGLAGRLIDEIARSPDPDLALSHFARLLTPLWNPGVVTSLLASDPAATRRLILLFASSESLTRDFQMHPDLLEVVVQASKQSLIRARSELADEIESRLKNVTQVEDSLAVLRTVRREETLRVGLQDLSGQLAPFAVGQQLTFLAEELLRRVLALARQEIASKFGEPPVSSLAVLGFGSLGGAELDYESDLDLVFVHDAQGTSSGGDRGVIEAAEWASRVSQRMMSFLTMPSAEGVLYLVDTRLRPSGTQGPLVASFDAFAEYHGVRSEHGGARGSDLWERQALLRARPIAGDRGLCARITTDVLEASIRRPLPADAAKQIREMRYRLDVPPTDEAVKLKKGPGGLLDIDFLVQFLQLKTGLRNPSTREGLRTLMKQRALDRELGEDLLHAHLFLRHLESRLRLMYGRSDVFVPRKGPGLVRLARQSGDVGAGASKRLWNEVERTMVRTREIFNLVLSS